jgi:dipeptidyl aminopeptidase/acylaminoacyl peptidase
MDDAWERSALKHVAKVHTPSMLVHGENDANVPLAEAEQYFVALKDVGVDRIFVRYPRGHGLHETKHIVDWIDRSVAWYQSHFPKPGSRKSYKRPTVDPFRGPRQLFGAVQSVYGRGGLAQ